MNVSQFVLQSSLQAAEKVLEDESRLVVSTAEMEWLYGLLDQPARDLPRLRESMTKPMAWDE